MKTVTRTLASLVLGSTLCLACSGSSGTEEVGESAPSKPPVAGTRKAAPVASGTSGAFTSATIGPLTFEVPEAWVKEPPENSMRVGQFALPGGDGASLVIFFFGVGGGGSITANFDRWVGQMSQPDGSSSEARAVRSSSTRDGMTIHQLDVSGDYGGGMSGGGGSNWRMLGGIVECTGGPYFFKLTGPAATVDAAMAGYDRIFASMTVAG